MPSILSLDIGTTNIKCFVMDEYGHIVYRDSVPFSTIYPRSGWVEQDPIEIYNKAKEICNKTIREFDNNIAGLGIANQRATTVLWRENGEPVYNAITWMDIRGDDVKRRLKGELGDAYGDIELFLNPNASSMHIRWILDNVEGVRREAESGRIYFGTLNTYLIWRLTEGEVFSTDPSNAIATGMYEPLSDDWFEYLLDLLGIPMDILPSIKDNIDDYGVTSDLQGDLKIHSSAGDQQAALFGEACFERGDMKITHGTGSFIDVNIGGEFILPEEGLLPLVAWRYSGDKVFMIEGYIYNTGALIDWMMNNGLISGYDEIDTLDSTSDDRDVFFVPALTGLGAPFWDSTARGLIIGLTRDVTREDISRAALEGIAFRALDIINLMREGLGVEINSIRVDGGLARSDYLQQFMADLTGLNVERPLELDASGVGVAYMAGIGLGIFKDLDQIKSLRKVDKVFQPSKDREWVDKKYSMWRKAVERACGWC